MSFCRFSCDGFRSDVYVYADISGGYAVHVAGSRISNFTTAPEYPEFIFNNQLSEDIIAKYIEKQKIYDEWLKTAERVSIEDEYAGESFMFSTGKDASEFLSMLKDRGYYVPKGVIEQLFLDHDDVPFYEDDLK